MLCKIYHFISKVTNKLEEKDGNLYPMQIIKKQVEMAMLTLHKIDFTNKWKIKDHTLKQAMSQRNHYTH